MATNHLYREWRVSLDKRPPTLFATINGPFGDQVAIERVGGGLVVITSAEARKLAAALIEAANQLEEA